MRSHASSSSTVTAPRSAVAPRNAAPILALAAGLLAIMPSSPARAAGYLALDGSSVTLGDGFSDELNPRGGRLRVGMRLADALDLELHAGLSADRDVASFDRFEAGWVGAYLKGYLPIGERSALFALGGVSGIELVQTIGESELSDERGGFSWGVGLETTLTERIDLSADWMRYLADEGAFERVDAVSLGLKLYF